MLFIKQKTYSLTMQPGLKHKATENITKDGSLLFPHRSSSPIQFLKTGGTFISTKAIKSDSSGNSWECTLLDFRRWNAKSLFLEIWAMRPCWNSPCNRPLLQLISPKRYFFKKITINNGGDMNIERFHMTSGRPYWCSKTMKRLPCWCSKTMKRLPCWCSKPVLLELNSFLM